MTSLITSLNFTLWLVQAFQGFAVYLRHLGASMANIISDQILKNQAMTSNLITVHCKMNEQENISDTLKSLSKEKKQWCIFEINMAGMETIYKRMCKNGCLVIALYETDAVPAKQMPFELLD
ncbi:hypothetical protein MAR_035630 [Mya arenaria]|uniref:Uncharacterized protein n=1 Tax=Mya arenaria TaxID=6604 RepID=A0ABY7ENL7_MYAAR|nr:hypothetical protein MAR_035630 [Mya arenaria]